MTDAPKTHLRVNTPHVIHETIDGEVIVINLASGNYYSLRGSGASVWEILATGPSGVDEVVTVAGGHFDASPDEIRAGVAPFVEQLMAEELVVWGNGQRDGAGIGGAAPDVRQRFAAPSLEKYTDMQDLVLLDPVHEVDATGWPQQRPDDQTALSGAQQS